MDATDFRILCSFSKGKSKFKKATSERRNHTPNPLKINKKDPFVNSRFIARRLGKVQQTKQSVKKLRQVFNREDLQAGCSQVHPTLEAADHWRDVYCHRAKSPKSIFRSELCDDNTKESIL